MKQADTDILTIRSRQELLRRNENYESFFEAGAPRLTEACREMILRFLAGS